MRIFTSTESHRSVAAFTACICAVFVLSTGTALAGHGNCKDATALEIGLATWDGATLTVEGCVEPRSAGGDVEVIDADNANSLGTDTPKNNGHWEITSSTCAENVFATRGTETTASFPVTGPDCPGAGTNTPPVANDDPGNTVLVSDSITINVLANDSDAEDGTPPDPAKVTVTIVTAPNPLVGTAVVNPDDTITYTNIDGLAGTDSLVYRLTDSGDPDATPLFDEALVSITINEPPTPGELPKQTEFKMLMNYELGMHCTGFEFAYCCVLPVYNSILAQVVKNGNHTGDGWPRLLEADPNLGQDPARDDVLGRMTVLRDRDTVPDDPLDPMSPINFQKYVLRYWHDAQPRNDGRGKAQDGTLISDVEGHSLLAWNTVANAAKIVGTEDPCVLGPIETGTYNGAKNVVLGNSSLNDVGCTFGVPIDNYQNAVWNHLYIYSKDAAGVEGEGGHPGSSTEALESKKHRLGLHVDYPANFGPAGHPMQGALTWSTDHGTVVYTQMKVLEDLPITLTSPRIWEALGLPLTPFEDSIDFFGNPGLVGEESIRPFVAMKAQLHYFDDAAAGGIGGPVFDSNDNEVIGFGTAPIDIPNCERCHSAPPCKDPTALPGDATCNEPSEVNRNSANADPADWALVQEEIGFWKSYYDIDVDAGQEDWYARLKGAAISILAIHDAEHGTSFTAHYPANPSATAPLGAECVTPDTDPTGLDCSHTNYGPLTVPVTPGDLRTFPQNTRLGHESVICQKCHADNVIAVVKSANCDSTTNPLCSGPGDPLIKPLTEAIHWNHRETSEGGNITFTDASGRSGGCQGCHPAHRSDGLMVEFTEDPTNPDRYPISLDGDNAFEFGDNRAAAGGCFVGRDVHSNPMKDTDGAGTPEHLNPVGEWLQATVSQEGGQMKGIWCTNCHSQASQEMWKAEDCADLINGDCVTNVREAGPNLVDVVNAINDALGTTTTEDQFKDWLDPADPAKNPARGSDQTSAIWAPDPGLCDYVDSALDPVTYGPVKAAHDANVAVVAVSVGGPGNCPDTTLDADGDGTSGEPGDIDPSGDGSGGDRIPCNAAQFHLCGSYDPDGDFNVALVGTGAADAGGFGGAFCTTPDCLASATPPSGTVAVPVPFSAATDGRDHWLAPGEPHCADCHAAPYTEQSGNINAFAPFNYPRKASLMRYSRGHQDITCQGCHESIHGLYPVTPPSFSSTGTAIDSTSYAQAASLNADDSHGPVKCGACHVVNNANDPEAVPVFMSGNLPCDIPGVPDGSCNNFDEYVSWMHTYTEEATVLDTVCQNCHNHPKKTNRCKSSDGPFCVDNTDWNMLWYGNAKYYNHKKPSVNRIDRSAMNNAEREITRTWDTNDPNHPCPNVEGGCLFGDPDPDDNDITVWDDPNETDGQDPFDSLCLGCHTGTNSNETLVACNNNTWKLHLEQGRVPERIWEDVSVHKTGTTCGW